MLLLLVGAKSVWHSDIQFFYHSTGRLFVVDIAIVNIDAATALRRRGDFGDVEASLVQVEDKKKALPIPARLEQTERGSTVFVPSADFLVQDLRNLGDLYKKSPKERIVFLSGK